jgi:carbon-monoxide dehydrogenase large subunit
MDKALNVSDWSSFNARKQETEARGKLRGRGIAMYLESAAPFNDRMELRFDSGGDITIIAGTHSHGQGHETVYSQMIAEFLGMPYERIYLLQGDTDSVAMGRGTIGSRSMTVGGSALKTAANIIIKKAKRIASHLLEASETDIEFKNGDFNVVGTDKNINIVDIAKMSFTPMNWPSHLGIGLEAVSDFNPGKGNFPNGCQIAEVEIDPETGKVQLDRLVIVSDVGTIINPLLLNGQIHGGVTQGIGQALFENMVYDQNTGQLLTASFQDYCMPRADDLPKFETDELPVPTNTNPLGVKGAGETGTVGSPPAIIGAITNAIEIDDITMPATPEKIWLAIEGNKIKR